MRKYRKYVFAVVYRKNGKPKILILHRIKNWTGWEFLKGGLKKGENVDSCLAREILEETGAKRYEVKKTNYTIKYDWPKWYTKDSERFNGAVGKLFIVRIFNKKIKIDRSEHDKFKWVSPNNAIKYLTHKEQKNALKYVLKNHML